MKKLVIDPSGFTCSDCHNQFPWVASCNEKKYGRCCRFCMSKRPASRRGRGKQYAKRVALSFCIRCHKAMKEGLKIHHDKWACNMVFADMRKKEAQRRYDVRQEELRLKRLEEEKAKPWMYRSSYA